MNDFTDKLIKVVLASSVVLVASVPVLAQDRSAALEEIIVTAQKRTESLQDTPISMAAFDQNTIEALGVIEAGDISDYTPNLHMGRKGNKDQYGFNIRGVSQGGTDLLVEPTVGLYADGVYLARNIGAAFDLVDMERAEVLRGPQGALYGRNTIGGAINLISKKPAEEYGFKQQVSIGNQNFIRSTTNVDTGKFADNFAAKLSYSFSDVDGDNHSTITGESLGAVESQAWRVALRWTPSDSVTADYVYDASRRDSSGSFAQLTKVRDGHVAVGGTLYKQAAAAASSERLGGLPVAVDAGDIKTDMDGHALTVEWDHNNITYKSITAYRDWSTDHPELDFGSFASDGTTVLDGKGGLVPKDELVSMFFAERYSRQDQFSQEFQMQGLTLDDRLKYTLGLYYFEETTFEDNPQTFAFPASFAYARLPAGTQAFLCGGSTTAPGCSGKDTVIGAPLFKYGADVESTAIYGQFTYSATDQLDVTLGLRYTEDKKNAFLENGTILRDEKLAKVEDDNSWTNFSPSLIFNYAFNDDVSGYFTWASGYRSGGYNARATTSGSFANPFDEENITSYEVGLKSEWLDSRLRFNAAMFMYEYEDRQVSQFQAGAGGASTVITNAGRQEAKGFELEITALPLPGLMIMANYGYVDNDTKEYISTTADPISGFAGKVNADIADMVDDLGPKNTGAVIAIYDFEPTDWGQWGLQVDVTYVGVRRNSPLLNLYDTADSYDLLNARLTLSEIPVATGSLRLAAWGKNLNDEEYRITGIDFGALGYATNNYGELRSYGIDIIYEY